MDSIIAWLKINVLTWLAPPKTIEIIDIVQIVLIAFFIYKLITWLKNSRAYALLKGILIIVVFVVIANLLKMDTIIWLLQNLATVAVVAVIIIFQPELRRALEKMGHQNPIRQVFGIGQRDYNKKFTDQTLSQIVRATFEMAEAKTGALIILEGDLVLNEYVETGIPVDAVVTSQLLINIFENKTPLHDGAVVISNDRVKAATCYLPLSENMSVSKNLGTRHRAGLGITEISDSFAIIVSEETGKVSYSYEGRLVTDVVLSELREELYQFQLMNPKRNSVFRRREDD